MEENQFNLPQTENMEKKSGSSKASILLVLLALVIGFAAGRSGGIVLPQSEKSEMQTVYLATETRYYTAVGGEPDSITTEERDTEGRLIRMSVTENGETRSLFAYTYDARGNVLESISYNAGGEIEWRDTFTYDENDNQLTYREYGGGDEILYWSETIYDKNGNSVQDNYYNGDGSLSSSVVYSTAENADGTRTEASYTYDANGIVIAHTLNSYAANGSLLRSEFYNEDGSVDIWEYSYTPFEMPADVAENY